MNISSVIISQILESPCCCGVDIEETRQMKFKNSMNLYFVAAVKNFYGESQLNIIWLRQVGG